MAIQNFFVQDGLNVNNFITANSTQLKTGTNTFINSTALYIGNNFGLFLAANNSLGSNGLVLTSNGTTVYWSTPAAGVNTAAAFTWTNTHSFSGNITIANTAFLSANGSPGTNGQFLASNGTTIYWTAPTASAAAGGPNTSVQFANGTAIAGNGNFLFDYLLWKVKIGSGGSAMPNNTVLEIDNSANTYIEINIQNANTGNNSSADISMTADSGDASTDYINMGINGSTYTQTAYSIVGAKDGYLYTSNGHLAIGTANNKEIRIHAGGTTTNNQIAAINSTAIKVTSNVALVANNSGGANGSVLISNGSAFSWSPIATITWAAAAGQTWF